MHQNQFINLSKFINPQGISDREKDDHYSTLHSRFYNDAVF